MDGTRRETERRWEVKRRFVGVRLDTQIMTTAYEWVLPWMRGRDGTAPTARAGDEAAAGNEANVSTPRRAAGA